MKKLKKLKLNKEIISSLQEKQMKSLIGVQHYHQKDQPPLKHAAIYVRL